MLRRLIILLLIVGCDDGSNGDGDLCIYWCATEPDDCAGVFPNIDGECICDDGSTEIDVNCYNQSDLDILQAAETWGGVSMTIPVLIIIIPLVYISLRLQFYDYFLVDEECNIVEAVKKSMAITKGYVMELFLLGAVMSIIVLVSIIPLGAGLFISIPLTTMVNTYVYQKLKRAN